ncbi:conserved hypothetical protein [Ricinus communis]|uniref:Uncharacterized protein n=1 Tax=Ricinus communis TaxID=3988 RepID=B9RP31_RICCO|nr:conserved hypothetical protein [Ricinus communis]
MEISDSSILRVRRAVKWNQGSSVLLILPLLGSSYEQGLRVFQHGAFPSTFLANKADLH